MPNTVIVQTRVTQEVALELARVAARKGITVYALTRMALYKVIEENGTLDALLEKETA